MKKKMYLVLCFLVGMVIILLSVYFFYLSTITNNDIDFVESSKSEVTVCLKENDLFKQSCINEDKQFLSSLTDEIRISFNYERINSSAINTNFEYYIDSNLVIYNSDNNKEIFNDHQKLSKVKVYNGDKEVNTIQDNTIIKYDSYNDRVIEEINKYALYANSNLEVNFVIKENDNEKIISSVIIPLGLRTYSISKNDIEKNEEVVNNKQKNYVFVSVLLIVIDILFMAIVMIRTFKSKNKSEFELEINKLLVEYDKIIVETTEKTINLENKQVTRLDNFSELVDVRDTIEKPILYIYRDEKTRDFVVQDDNIIYIYTMVDNK